MRYAQKYTLRKHLLKALAQTILSASEKCIYKSQVKAMNYDYARAEEIQLETFEFMIIITPIR